MYKPGLLLLPSQNKTQHNHVCTFATCCLSMMEIEWYIMIVVFHHCLRSGMWFWRSCAVRTSANSINFSLSLNIYSLFRFEDYINCELWAAFAHGERSLSTELLTNVSFLPFGVLQNKTRDRYDLFQSALKYLFNLPISICKWHEYEQLIVGKVSFICIYSLPGCNNENVIWPGGEPTEIWQMWLHLKFSGTNLMEM